MASSNEIEPGEKILSDILNSGLELTEGQQRKFLQLDGQHILGVEALIRLVARNPQLLIRNEPSALGGFIDKILDNPEMAPEVINALLQKT